MFSLLGFMIYGSSKQALILGLCPWLFTAKHIVYCNHKSFSAHKNNIALWYNNYRNDGKNNFLKCKIRTVMETIDTFLT